MGSEPARARSRPGTMREEPVAGVVPRRELTEWRERFGIVAGITGRGGEEGEGFDLGLGGHAPVGGVTGRWRALRAALPGADGLVLGHQVHGAEVATVGAARGWLQMEGIDGWVTTTPGTYLAVTVADCIPVYLTVPGRGIALLHAGWRGLAGAILGAGIERLLLATGGTRADVVMHCGVGICGACYEVGSEVMAGCRVPHGGPGPFRLDLRAVLADQAAALGVAGVTLSPWCSAHDRVQFFSHRASGGRAGRMVAYLGMPRDRNPSP
ncbi:MAG TPA: polyphenol oxidase family protein [Gemmatimonadales bacterium]|nr:polyphenol oxidase family protein [Gemmatimonadales bacterium]